jgi:hypothetical protein
MTSLYKIKQELEGQESYDPGNALQNTQQLGKTELQWLKRVLPRQFMDYTDIFSQEASNELPLHHLYNHKITIDDPKGPDGLRYSLLCHHSEHKLQEMKCFLEEKL